MLSYSYYYWIQVGYLKGFQSPDPYVLTWYYEVRDLIDPQIKREWKGHPNAGSWYHYWIDKDKYTGVWTVEVSSEWTQSIGKRNPNLARDYHAMSETTTPSIYIDGTWFQWLCTCGRPPDWDVWQRHIPKVDEPYHLLEVSHYEFKAWGGS